MIVRRSWWVIGAGVVLSLAASTAFATKVAVVLSRSLPPYQEALQGFQQTGFSQVQSLNLDGDPGKAAEILEAVTAYQPDEILIFGAEAFSVLKNGLPNVPLVYSMVLEPLEGRGRSAGVLMQIPVSEQIKGIRNLLPGTRKVGVLYNAAYSLKTINQCRAYMDTLQMTLVPITVESVDEIPSALQKMKESNIEVLWSVVDKTATQPGAVEQMIKFSLAERIPYIALSIFHVKAGALAAFSVDYRDLGAQTGIMAKRLLASAAEDGQVETPRKVIIYLNSDTAKRLDLKNLANLPEIQVVQ